MIKYWLFALFISSIFIPSYSYFITVDAHAEECFFEKVETGTKMGKLNHIFIFNFHDKYVIKLYSLLKLLYFSGLTFEIAEGGFLDIDVRIVGPDNKVIYQGERETSGKFTFAAHTQGVYTYCFSNKMSTMTPKVIVIVLILYLS